MKRDWLWIGACFGLGEVLYYTIRPVWIFLILTIAAMIAGVYLIRKINNCKDLRRAVIICGIAFFIGAGRLAIAEIPPPMPEEGDVLTVENLEEKNGKLVITAGHALIYWSIGGRPYQTNLVCEGLSPIDQLKIGNRIIITGSFQENSHATNPGQFDFDIYYRSKGIYYTGFADDVTVVSSKVNWPKQLMLELRENLSQRILKIYNEDDAGFLIAALLGDKSSLDSDMYDLYRRNGIAHLLAISGLHIAIIGMGLYKLLRKRLSFRTSGIIAGVWIILYTIFTGASVSTVRACIMLLITFLAAVKGRKADLLNSAGFAATFVLMISPYELFNCGMLLSFGAVIGIGAVAKELCKRLRPKKIAEAFLVSFSVQLFTLPIMAYFFFEISLYGIFLNLIVIPLMTYVVWSGIASVILSFILMTAARTAAFSCHIIISIYNFLCGLCDKLPFHTILIGRPKIWQIVIYYFFLFAVLYWPQFHEVIRKFIEQKKKPDGFFD